nr:immunoglobulin heavy chain junction region [Macaca mulatta]MOV49203.1 immunoglobulin heavy chain junction region [Macaca mulatta]MOV49433.1 immunoglobulin heavy chain junction region [Macaca mulatta]MOV51590.1 immunoglobulin heavy chain junction region [Macaca mulatta]MOV51905.1 immunoglobulin heavy chain junction region [Macaca mulatta]
CARKNVNFDFW